MTPSQWEGICRRSGFTPLEPIKFTHGRILLAERYYIRHPEFENNAIIPHWQVQWVVDRDDIQNGGRKLFIKAPSITEPSRAARINAAVADARQFTEDSIESGEFSA